MQKVINLTPKGKFRKIKFIDYMFPNKNLQSSEAPFRGFGGYLSSAIKRLKYYKELGDKTFVQLEEKDLHFISAEEDNSIAIIIQHMHGNMLSRWTNFLIEDGEKEWRKRDEEFIDQYFTKEKLIKFWEEGWQCFFNALESLTEIDLVKTIFIRTEPLTVIDAINRQLAHYPYHIGQIIYVAKLLKNKTWQTLSIPRGKSAEFNSELKNQP